MTALVSELGEVVGVTGACTALDVRRADYYRRGGAAPRRAPNKRRPPPRALRPSEQQEVVEMLHSERFGEVYGYEGATEKFAKSKAPREKPLSLRCANLCSFGETLVVEHALEKHRAQVSLAGVGQHDHECLASMLATVGQTRGHGDRCTARNS